VQVTTPTKLFTKERGAYFIVDSATGVAEALPGLIGQRWGPRAKNIRALGTAIVDLNDGRVLGDVDDPPVGVDVTGRALLTSSQRVGDEIASGPLRWIVPSPRRAQP
jgi:hypothetical protein